MSHDETLPKTELAGPARASASAWAWATEHGAPEYASTEQLVAWLGRGELPPHTLVWKPGWGEWLPAMQVAELAAAFPSVTAGSRRVARAAADASSGPPAVPVAHYPRLRLLAKDVLSESPLPPAAADGLEPAPIERYVFRDLDRLQKDLVTSQVPAAAMLEAARSMQQAGAPAKSSAERWSRLQLGTFGEPPPGPAPPPSSSPPTRTLSPFELGVAGLLDAELAASSPRRYGVWLLLGALVAGALGVRSLSSLRAAPPVAIAALQPAPAARASLLPPIEAAPHASVEPSAPVMPTEGIKTARVVETNDKRSAAVLRTVRATERVGFDRIEFEFRERVPGYHLEYIDEPIFDCATGDARQIDGGGRLEVSFFPASAHGERAEPALAARALEPQLSVVRELDRTCDFEGIVTWVVGTAAPNRYRAFELSAPARLVVDIDH